MRTQDIPTRLVSLVGLLVMLSALQSHAQVYQWSATIDQVIARESNGHPRAFLWIPEGCQRVRAVVLAIQNMQEEQLFGNAEFRRTLGELNFGIIWITPPMGTNDFRFDQGEDKILQDLLNKLAGQSGYSEIATAPLVPLGHSASASWCWDVAAWNPQRTLAVVSLSGQWPYFTAKDWGDRSVDDVPGLTTKGEFEIEANLERGWYAGLKGDFYAKHPNAAFTQVVEPGDGHFAASDEKVALVGLFLRKAAQYRLPQSSVDDESPVRLTPINAGKSGWRYEVWHVDKPPQAPAAPVGQFKGKLDRSFWALDEEMVRAIERFQATQRDKINTLIGYRQKNGLTPPTPDHLMSHLKFEPIDDSLTFKLSGGFFDTVPSTKDGKTAGWQKMLGNYTHEVEQGKPIPHPTGRDDSMTIVPICGPVKQMSKDIFAVRFNRIGFDNPKRCSSICFILTYPGDSTYKRMVQQAELRFPLANKSGQSQTIDFPAIPDVKLSDSPKLVKINATSSAGAHVYYYVREGPAEVDDSGALTFTPIPPRAKLPLQVTVVAWQYGRASEPRLKTAEPVERSFFVTK